MTTTLMTRLLLLAAVVFVATGCDQNAFEEDYPDPETGLGTYVAFNAVAIQSDFSSSFDDDNPGLGTVINVRLDSTRARTFGVPVRLPAAIGEDVTVSYTVESGDALGTEFNVYSDSVSTGTAASLGAGNRLVIEYDITQTGSFSENIVFTAPITFSDVPTRTFSITLNEAVTASGQALTIGRLPNGRDQKITVNLLPPNPAPPPRS